MRKYFRKNESGAALLFSIILISIMMGVGLTLSTIFVGKLRASIDAKSSVGAYYAADSGIEWNLYEKRIGPEAFGNQLGIGSEFEVEETAEYTRSLGTYRGVSRAIEVVDLEVSPTPTPPPACPGGLTFGASQDDINATEIIYLLTASVPGILDTGHSFNLAGDGTYQLFRTYTRTDVDRSESVSFLPDGVGIACATLGLNIPKKDLVPTPPPAQCSDSAVSPINLSETHAETGTTITFTLTSNRSGLFIGGPNPRTFNKQGTARLETVKFVADYQSLGCEKNITLSIPALVATPTPVPAPKYEWVRINSNTYPSLTAKSNGCGATMRVTKVCNRNGVGMITRMYNVTVGDGIGQGWAETPQAAAVGQGIGSNITYTRFVGCSHRSFNSVGPGTRVYECKNTGGPKPKPAPPPAYQWVRIGTQPKFQPHVPAINFEAYWCPDAGGDNTTITCSAGNVNKIAIAEYKNLGFVVLTDRGTHYQGYSGNIQADKTKLKLDGFNRTRCRNEAPATLKYMVLGAGYQGWNAWQCQKSDVVAINEPPSLFARIMDSLVNFFTSIF